MFASASPWPLMCRSATSRFTSPSTTSFKREWSLPTSSTMPLQRSTGVPPATSKTPNLIEDEPAFRVRTNLFVERLRVARASGRAPRTRSISPFRARRCLLSPSERLGAHYLPSACLERLRKTAGHSKEFGPGALSDA